MNKIYLKKIGATILLFGLGLVFYFFALIAGSLPIVLLVSFLLHLIASVFFVWTKYRKVSIFVVVFLILFQSIIALVQFPRCKIPSKIGGEVTSCVCKGFKKQSVFGSTQCIGKRAECYKFGEGDTLYELLEEYGTSENKTQISCDEMDNL